MLDSNSSFHPDPRYGIAMLLAPASLVKLVIVAAIVGIVALLFVWAGGWFSPGRLTQDRFIDTFQDVNGVHPGFRRNHAKGVCLEGTFESNGAGARLSRASVFKPGRVPVFGRFSLAGGMPTMPDGPAAVRSMALNFTLADGEVWRTGMIVLPVFPFRDPHALYEQLDAAKPDPRTGKPDPAALRAFAKAHPETVKALEIVKAHPFSSGFANARYNALNAFLLIDAAGKATPVRWSMAPVDAFVAEPSSRPDDENYLFDALIQRMASSPAQWHLILTVGQPGDPADDATLPWPADRKQIDAGTLSVTRLSSEAAGNCRDVNFDPLALPAGIAPSNDPLLSARSAAYSVSFTRRESEPKTPSAVQVTGGK
jgi:catalase